MGAAPRLCLTSPAARFDLRWGDGVRRACRSAFTDVFGERIQLQITIESRKDYCLGVETS